MWRFSSPGELLCYLRPRGTTGERACCISGPAAGLCAVGCSDADGDGQYRADTGHYFMSEMCCFAVTVSQEVPVE